MNTENGTTCTQKKIIDIEIKVDNTKQDANCQPTTVSDFSLPYNYWKIIF
jgi:hypothetical protein